MAFHDVVLQDSPKFYFRCNELSGTALADAADSYPGSLFSPATLGQAPMGEGTVKAIAFSGGRIEVPYSAALVPSGDYAIEQVMRWSSSGVGMAFGLAELVNPPFDGPTVLVNYEQAIGGKAGAVTFRDSGNSSYALTVGGLQQLMLNDDVFRHFMFVRRGMKLEAWLDGVLAGEVTLPSIRNSVGTGPLFIMGRPGQQQVTGALDEVAFYHHAPSPARIALHARIAKDLWLLKGNATLDSGAAATKVVARAWATREHKNETTPSANGDFEMYVPNGQYDVTVFGPAGYQPITHGPVTTVEPV